jgi:hypothetical protein
LSLGRDGVALAQRWNSARLDSVYLIPTCKEAAMGLMDVLGRYTQSHGSPPPQVMSDFHQVAQEAPQEMVSAGLTDAFRSDATPPFEQMVGQLFGHSDPHQRAGALNEILGSLGGGAGGGLLSGGVLGGLLRHAAAGKRIAPEDTQEVQPADVEVAAREAARNDPGIVERLSRFYAQHPQLVQGLGQAAIGIAMSSMARRRNTL